MTNYCHLSYEDKKNIEDGLNDKLSYCFCNKINSSMSFSSMIFSLKKHLQCSHL